MKKLPYFVVGILILSTFSILGLSTGASDQQETINLSFSDIEVFDSQVNTFVELNYEGAGAKITQTSAPMLPVHTTKMTFEFGTKITDIICETSEVNSMALENKVIPSPTPVFPGLDESNEIEYVMDEAIYNSNDLFPNNWYDYHVGVGLDENGNHKTFLTIRVYPVRYSPGLDTLKYVNNVELKVNYEPGTNPFPQFADYELVIIAPNSFSSDLNKLVTHKNDMGVSTFLKTTEDIYSEYSGVDKPEKIKYFIKDALETNNIKYVLLVGGLKSLIWAKPRDDQNQGTKDWHLPVRYTNLRETQGGTYDPGFISDLYYADIYKEGGEFDDWDSNDDGIFAKWSNTPGKDVIDFYPDVAVGRLACRNKIEVKVMVNKIINYEKNAHGSSWYDKIIAIGGDSHDDAGTNYVEGEVVCEEILNNYMTEYDQVRIYASYKNSNPSYVPYTDVIKREINKGAGHLFLDGHANPASWITHFPGEFEDWIPGGGITIFDFPFLFNGGKLPICNVEGCHNSQFNVSMIEGLKDTDNSAHMWTYGGPIPECWSWWLTRKIGGGSLATLGNTGLGYGAVGEHGDLDEDGVTEPDCLEALGGYWFLKFYEAFDEGYDILGETWVMTESKYLDTFPGMSYQADAKTVEQMALLGDPSLQIGGYPSTGFSAEIPGAEAGIIGAPDENVILEANAFNGQEPYTYNWDFDDDGVFDDAEGKTVSNSWSLPSVNWVSVKVTDNTGKTDVYSTIVGIEMGADKPNKPAGQTSIKAGQTYEYTASINTYNGYWNKIFYKFSWGDGTETGWLETSKASHSWANKGTYAIKVKAMLAHESAKGDPEDFEDLKETDWSDPLNVILPRTRTRTINPLIQLIQNFFANYPNAFPLLQQLLGL